MTPKASIIVSKTNLEGQTRHIKSHDISEEEEEIIHHI